MGRTWVLLSLCVVGLAACSGESDSGESASSATEETSARGPPSPATGSTLATTTTTIPPPEPGPFVGTFYNIDSDGSHQQLTIAPVEPSGDEAYLYSFIYADQSAIACIDVVGRATAIGDARTFVALPQQETLAVEGFTFYCLLEGPFDRRWPFGEPVPAIQLRYEIETDRLLTTFTGRDSCWTREAPGPERC